MEYLEQEANEFPDYDTFCEIVSDLMDELPEPFFKDLSGGVVVEERALASEYARADDLYTLGTYTVSPLGRQVALYYGSFRRLFPFSRGERLVQQIRDTLRHEFRHHMEFLAGMHGKDSLEEVDRQQMRRYLRGE